MAALKSEENSTTVRKKPLAARVAGAALRTIARVDRHAAAKVAADLFMRTRRGTPSERSRAQLALLRPFTVQAPIGRLAGWYAGDGPPVYLLHGWNGRGTQLTSFVTPLVSAGFRAVLFDAAGHGDSDGDRAHIGLFRDSLAAVVALQGRPAGVIAHSLGAAASAHLASRGGLADAPLVLVGTAGDPSQWVRTHLGGAGLLDGEVGEAMRARLQELTGIALDDIPLSRLAPRQPVLFVHDLHDEDTSYAGAAPLAALWPDARLVTTEGLGHTRVLRDPAVVATAVRFLLDPRAELPAKLPGEAAREADRLEAELFDRSARPGRA